MYRIYLVEDDKAIAGLVKENLIKWGFECKTSENYSDILSEFVSYSPQLVLMDISLPFYNGYYWCEKIRAVSKTPIIFLSSHSDNMDIIMAMNMGGDDYITKPFSLNVLTAKINAVLRRAYSYRDELSALSVKGALLDMAKAELIYNEKVLPLTKNELKILSVLYKNKNSVTSRETIMRELWNDESFIDDNTLTVNINRLRTKLDEIGLKDFIITKKGLGYVIFD